MPARSIDLKISKKGTAGGSNLWITVSFSFFHGVHEISDNLVLHWRSHEQPREREKQTPEHPCLEEENKDDTYSLSHVSLCFYLPQVHDRAQGNLTVKEEPTSFLVPLHQ